MQSEGCLDWKIDPKDPKLCRNCKKPKVDHQAPRSATREIPPKFFPNIFFSFRTQK